MSALPANRQFLGRDLSLGKEPPAAVAEARAAVVAVAQRMSRLGLVVSVWGNASARVKGTDLAVVTPSGVEYEAMTDDMPVVVDIPSGVKVSGHLRPSSETRTHLSIYRAREDVLGVIHTHSIYASAFAVARQAIPSIVEDMAQVVGGSVDCAEYAPPGTQELANQVVRALGRKNAVLMANHGVVGVGPSPAEALRVCQVVEKSAQVHAIARMIGRPAFLSPEEVASLRGIYLTSYGQKQSPGE